MRSTSEIPQLQSNIDSGYFRKSSADEDHFGSFASSQFSDSEASKSSKDVGDFFKSAQSIDFSVSHATSVDNQSDVSDSNKYIDSIKFTYSLGMISKMHELGEELKAAINRAVEEGTKGEKLKGVLSNVIDDKISEFNQKLARDSLGAEEENKKDSKQDHMDLVNKLSDKLCDECNEVLEDVIGKDTVNVEEGKKNGKVDDTKFFNAQRKKAQSFNYNHCQNLNKC